MGDRQDGICNQSTGSNNLMFVQKKRWRAVKCEQLTMRNVSGYKSVLQRPAVECQFSQCEDRV